jgi:hypothetical protein
MKGVFNLSEANKVENNQGLLLYKNVGRGFICSKCNLYVSGNSSWKLGEDNFCRKCAEILGYVKPSLSKEEILDKQIKDFAKEHGLSEEQAKKALGVHKNNFTLETKNKQSKRMSLVRNRQTEKGITMAQAIKELKAEGLYPQ